MLFFDFWRHRTHLSQFCSACCWQYFLAEVRKTCSTFGARHLYCCARWGSSGIVLYEHFFELFTILDDYLLINLCSVDTPWASDSFGYCFMTAGSLLIRRYTSEELRSFRSTNSNRHVLPGGVASGVRLLGLNRTTSRRGRRAGLGK